jgi:hypothetical protein
VGSELNVMYITDDVLSRQTLLHYVIYLGINPFSKPRLPPTIQKFSLHVNVGALPSGVLLLSEKYVWGVPPKKEGSGARPGGK